MTQSKKRSVAIISIIVLVIFIGLFFVLRVNNVGFRNPFVFLPDSQQFMNTNRSQQFSPSPETYSLVNLKEVSGGTATVEVSHDAAAERYKNAHLVFDPNCRVTPVTIAIPPKSIVMFDNQSKWQRSIIVGPHTYTIQPYDYILAAFNDTGAYGITCDSVQDVGFISVQ